MFVLNTEHLSNHIKSSKLAIRRSDPTSLMNGADELSEIGSTMVLQRALELLRRHRVSVGFVVDNDSDPAAPASFRMAVLLHAANKPLTAGTILHYKEYKSYQTLLSRYRASVRASNHSCTDYVDVQVAAL